jgi:hypothetical protein
MRRFSGKWRPLASFLAASLLMLSLVCRGRFAFSQIQEPPQLPPLPSQQGVRVPFGQGQDARVDPSVRHAQLEAAKKRNIERQKRMVADANKIVELAQEINADVDKGDKSALSPTEAKKAEEIEKLAKGVKERMKSED